MRRARMMRGFSMMARGARINRPGALTFRLPSLTKSKKVKMVNAVWR
jgi:hypothetical protein